MTTHGTTTGRGELRNFDHTAISKFGAYYGLRRALDELARALDEAEYPGGLPEWVELVRDFAATTHFADYCTMCGSRTDHYWPVAAEMQDNGWLRGLYVCAAGHRWTCGWSVRDRNPPYDRRSYPRRLKPHKRSKLPFRAVWDRDNWECRNCGTHCDLTVDHIVPLARGGTDDLDNLQTLCRSCNSRKGASVSLEAEVLRMTRPERVAYLQSRGWHRVSARGVQSWRSPDEHDRGFAYSLAAAIRTAVAAQELHDLLP